MKHARQFTTRYDHNSWPNFNHLCTTQGPGSVKVLYSRQIFIGPMSSIDKSNDSRIL